jgi:hypothetical protein
MLAVITLAGWAVIGWVSYAPVFAAGATALGLTAVRRGL